MRTYIAGPMTGIKDFNFPLFHETARKLRERGHIVVNPAEINPDTAMSWEECMKADIKALVDCDAVYMLEGWKNSKGATLEHHIACRLGLDVLGHAE